MRQFMVLMCGALAWCVYSLPTSAWTAEPETVDSVTDARLLLARRNLTRDAKNIFVLDVETKLEKHVEWIGDMQKGIPTATASLEKYKRECRVLVQASAQLDQQFQTLTAQHLAAANPTQKNQISVILKDVTTKRSEAKKQLAAMPGQMNTHEAAVGAARKSLVDGILAGSKQVAEVEAAYAKLKKDPLVDKSLKLISKAEKEVTLGPTPAFQEYAEKVKKFEGLLIRQEIPLEEDGKTFTATLEVNDKHKIKFQVQPATRSTILTDEHAKQLGIVINPQVPQVPYQLSKEEKLTVPEVVINSIEWEGLKTSNVRAVVLPKAKVTGLPSLGTNFFAGRVIQLDAKNKKLKITRVKETSG